MSILKDYFKAKDYFDKRSTQSETILKFWCIEWLL